MACSQHIAEKKYILTHIIHIFLFVNAVAMPPSNLDELIQYCLNISMANIKVEEEYQVQIGKRDIHFLRFLLHLPRMKHCRVRLSRNRLHYYWNIFGIYRFDIYLKMASFRRSRLKLQDEFYTVPTIIK